MTTGETAAQRRHQAVYEAFRDYLEPRFIAVPTLQSALLVVSQYWCDEADDAVHGSVVFSRAECPAWPTADEYAEGATGGSPLDVFGEQLDLQGFLDWDDNGRAVEAFELFCNELGSQELPARINARPYAWARRTEAGIQIEVIGRVLRLDADSPARDSQESGEWEFRVPVVQRVDVPYRPPPGTEALFESVQSSPQDVDTRLVLADALLELQDPRGEFIVAQSSGNSEVADELQSRFAGHWLGPLQDVVCWASAEWYLGFLSRAHVYFETDAQAVATTTIPDWATVQTLSFRADSKIHYPKTLRALRHLLLLPTQLGAAPESGVPVTALTLRAEDGDLRELLAFWQRLPFARSLDWETSQAPASRVSSLVAQLRTKGLRELTVGTVETSTAIEWVKLALDSGLEVVTTRLCVQELVEGWDLRVPVPRMVVRCTADGTLRFEPPATCEYELCLHHAAELLGQLGSYPRRVLLVSTPRYDARRWVIPDAGGEAGAPRRQALADFGRQVKLVTGRDLEWV